ncbi:MAG: sulfotransferase family protein [Bacteroidota bacterium]
MQKIFILGNPRSGTSLFRLMLNQHSEIVAPPESGFLQWWYHKYNDWTKKDNFSNRLELFLNDLFTSKKIETWVLDREKLKNFIIAKNPADYGTLIGCVYLAYKSQSDNIRVIADKNNYFISHIPELKSIWPDAKFIHLIRDGRDVACSYIDVDKLKTDSPYKPKLPINIEQIANEWIKNNRTIAQLHKENSENYFLIKYEDIISKTQKALRGVCDFLDLNFEYNMLDYYNQKNVSKAEPLQTLDWKEKTRDKPDPKKIKRYKHDLNQEQIKLFNRIAEPELKLYGYTCE